MAEETVLLNFEIANSPSVESSRKKLIELKEEQAELTKAYRQGILSIDAYTKAISDNEKATQKERQELNLLKKTVDAEKGSVNDLIATNKRLVDERNNLSDSTEEGRSRIEEINKSLDANTKKLNLNISESERQKQGYNTLISILDKINPGTQQLVTNVGQIAGAFKNSVSAIGQYGLSLKTLGAIPVLQTFTAISGILTTLNEVYKKSLPTIEDYRKENVELTKEYNKQQQALELIEASVTRRIALLNAEGKEQEANKVASEAAAERLLAEQLRVDQLSKELIDLNEKLKSVSDQFDRFGENRNADEQKVIKEAIKQVNSELIIQREVVANILNEYNILQEQSARLQNQQEKEIKTAKDAREEELKTLNKVKKARELLAEQRRQEMADLTKFRPSADLAKRISAIYDLVSAAEAAKRRKDAELLEKLNKNFDKTSEKFLKEEKKKRDEQQKTLAINKLVDDQRQESVVVAAQAAATLVGIASKTSAEYKAFAIASTIISTYATAQKAYEAAFLPIPTIASPALGAAFAALAVVNGLANVAQITGIAAAGGADFVTSKPTMLLVGDNPGGRERVTVEPLSGRGQTRVFGDGIAMAGGGSMTFDPRAKDGGIVANANMEASRQALMMANILKNQPPIIASWTEGRKVGRRLEFKERITKT